MSDIIYYPVVSEAGEKGTLFVENETQNAILYKESGDTCEFEPVSLLVTDTSIIVAETSKEYLFTRKS